MSGIDYITIPSSATPLLSQDSESRTPSIKTAPKHVTTLPKTHRRADSTLHRRSLSQSSPSPVGRRSTFSPPTSPAKASPSYAASLIPQVLMSTLPTGAANPPARKGSIAYLSSKDPLSIPTTSVNFKRFIEVVGPVFWLQDRLEEIILWKRGARKTGVWIAVYVLLCAFPRIFFVLPHFALIAIIMATYTMKPTGLTASAPPQSADEHAPPGHTSVGIDVYQSNVQAIQNLMGFVADVYDYVLVPYVLPYLAPSSSIYARGHRYQHLVLTSLVVTFLPCVFLVSLPNLPVRCICLAGGLTPWICLHPRVRGARLPSIKQCRVLAARSIDSNNLLDEVWRSPMREVELWENERLDPSVDLTKGAQVFVDTLGFSKSALRAGVDRAAWTRGRDGWSDVGKDGYVSSNLTFSLSPGWRFVETEDWRPDLLAEWSGVGADDDGWVYTNDAWQEMSPVAEDDKVTRRRRWTRRIWYCGIQSEQERHKQIDSSSLSG
ncbi:hypothetical protein FISHEDRAFT_36919 [Fistulina hepatica ATCC 64428]|uniref:TECPR1-like DysF domain-containing protein n=1 Tax=Fistulina hepatica ATCC 64428 TaxID=1128425 RepID=A0A0D7AIX3_9AGAR|nr:hypothetical protein FISHEDRAFT_36919 [Fistulina hepatica ATCC 64428]